MSLPLIGFLGGISPLWWLAAGVVLLGLEAITTTTHLLWPALAAFGVALVLWLAPGIGAIAQLGLFALLTIALIPIGRALLERVGSRDGSRRLNRRADQLVGREAVVETFHWHEGQVNIDGVIWPARLEGRKTPEIGEHVRVIAADGIVVWVRRLPGAQRAGDQQELS